MTNTSLEMPKNRYHKELETRGFSSLVNQAREVLGMSDGRSPLPAENSSTARGMRYSLNHWLDIGEAIRASAVEKA